MKFIKAFCLFTLLFLVSYCARKAESKIVELTVDEKKVELNDSTFFGHVHEILYQDDMFYVIDNSRQLFKLDQSLNLIKSIHTVGRGPGEFNWITDIKINNDSLYLYDHSLAKIIVYNNDLVFNREFKLEAAGNTLSFEVSDNHIFLSTPFAEKPITMFDKNGEIIKTFGVQSADTSSFNVYRNSRHLIISDDKLIAVSESDPLVWIHSLNGELLSTITIEHPLIADRIAYIQESYKKPSAQGGYSLALLFRDAVVSNGKLYLLAHTHSTDVKENNFTLVLVYGIEENGQLKPLPAIKFYNEDQNNRFYGVELAVTQNKKVVYDDALLVFEEEKNLE